MSYENISYAFKFIHAPNTAADYAEDSGDRIVKPLEYSIRMRGKTPALKSRISLTFH